MDKITYTTLNDDVKNEFNFIDKDIVKDIDEALKELELGLNIVDAFYVESNGKTHKDISNLYNGILNESNGIKEELSILKNEYSSLIDLVNSELDNNYKQVTVKGDVDGQG